MQEEDEAVSGSDTPSLRVVIADDDAMTRRLLRDALQAQRVIVIAEARNGREAVELTLHYRPDVVLMDVNMPVVDGLEATRTIIARGVRSKVVLLSSSEDFDVILAGLRIGAIGFLTKSVAPESLPRALRAAHDGEAVVPRRMTMRLIDVVRRVREDGAGLRPVRSELTEREWEVLDLLCGGQTPDEVATTLFLAEETVRSHIKSIMRKLGVRSRRDAVIVANRLRSDLLVGTRR
jgi:DNA-binding NarL/FixJ family response regulator